MLTGLMDGFLDSPPKELGNALFTCRVASSVNRDTHLVGRHSFNLKQRQRVGLVSSSRIEWLK